MFLVSDIDFPAWLQGQMNRLNWSQSELARNAGLNRAVVNKILSSFNKPRPETLEAIAHALNLPPALVYEKAGLLPAERDSELTPKKRQLLHLLSELDDENTTDDVIAILESRVAKKHQQIPANGQLGFAKK